MKKFLETLTAWEGSVRGDAVHKSIVDAYNSFLPHPRGYKLTYTDARAGTYRARRLRSWLCLILLCVLLPLFG